MKRSLAWMLAVVMVFSVTAYAAEEVQEIAGETKPLSQMEKEPIDNGTSTKTTSESTAAEDASGERNSENSSTVNAPESNSPDVTDDPSSEGDSAKEDGSDSTVESSSTVSSETVEDFYADAPATAEEVLQLIEAYFADPENVAFPKWEHAIPEEWIPDGWEQVERTDTEEETGLVHTYYTLQELPMMLFSAFSTPIPVTTEAELITAMANAQNGDVISIQNTILLTQVLVTPENIAFTIEGNNGALGLGMNVTSRHIQVANGTTLTLQNINIVGHHVEPEAAIADRKIGGGIDVPHATSTLILNKARILNVNQPNGGAVNLSGTLNASNNTVFYNNVTSQNGAAIYNNGSGVIYAVDTAFENNKAGGNGGAIYTKGQTTLTGAEFTENEVNGSGGAVYIDNASSTVMSGATFTGNKAKTDGTNGNPGGGAIAGVASSASKKVDITDSTFTENYATGRGGAVALLSNNFRMSIKNTNFTNNQSGLAGGALSSYTISVLEDVDFTGNSAVNGGAADLWKGNTIIKRGSFTKNHATSAGGAIYGTNNPKVENVSFDGTTFSENTCDTGGVYWDETNPIDSYYSGEANTNVQKEKATIIQTKFNNIQSISQDASSEFTFTNLYNNLDIVEKTQFLIFIVPNGGNWESGTAGSLGGYKELWCGNTTLLENENDLFTGIWFPSTSATSDRLIKDGYEIDRWVYITKNGDEITWDVTNDIVRGPMTIAPIWVLKRHVVSFETYGGTQMKDIKVPPGNNLPTIPIPTKPGHAFAGWHADAMYTTPIDETSHIVTQNQTLHAKWVPIGDGGTTTPPPPAKPPVKPKPSGTVTSQPETSEPEETPESVVQTPTPSQPEEQPPAPPAEKGGIKWVGNHKNEWSATNLVLLIVGAVLSVLAFIETWRKRNKKEGEQKPSWMYELVIVVAFLAGLVLFLLTENRTLPMAILNEYSIIYGVLILVQLVTFIKLMMKADKEEKADTEDTA